MSRALMLVACALTAGISAHVVRAELVTYTLDPAQSMLTLSGNVNSSSFTAQQTNTNVTSYTGTIQVDRGVSTIQFLTGSAIDASLGSNLDITPDRMAQVGAPDGPFSADYAVRAPLGPLNDPTPNEPSTGYFTLFDLVLGATSNSIPVIAGNFSANAVTGPFTSGFYAYVQFGEINGNIPKSGTPTLVGNSALNAAATGSLASSLGIETLTLPVDLTFTSNNPDGINATFRLTGNLVATTSVPEVSGLWLLSVPTSGLLLQRIWRSRRGRQDCQRR